MRSLGVNILHPFKQPRWKLALSHAAGTIGALIVVEIILITAFSSQFAHASRLNPAELFEDLTPYTYYVESCLTQSPQDIEQTLFRIIQGSLSNIARHSGAQPAEIRLIYKSDTVMLSIVDDRRGFDPKKQPYGFGLHSIQERTEILKGSLDVISAIGKGTRSRFLAMVSEEKEDDNTNHCPYRQ